MNASTAAFEAAFDLRDVAGFFGATGAGAAFFDADFATTALTAFLLLAWVLVCIICLIGVVERWMNWVLLRLVLHAGVTYYCYGCGTAKQAGRQVLVGFCTIWSLVGLGGCGGNARGVGGVAGVGGVCAHGGDLFPFVLWNLFFGAASTQGLASGWRRSRAQPEAACGAQPKASTERVRMAAQRTLDW